MERYIRIIEPSGVSEEKTEFEYEVGDGILLNSKIHCKCVEVIKEDNKIIYVFKVAIIRYDYNW